MKAPVIRRIVNAAAAYLPPIADGPLNLRLVVLRSPKRIRLQAVIVDQRALKVELDLVVREVFFPQVRALLQNHYMKTGRGQFLGDHASGSA